MLRGTPTSQNSSFLRQGGVKLKLAGELLRQACGTIYSFQYGVSFALFKAPHQRSLQQSGQLFLGPAQSSVYGLLLAHRPVVVRAVQRWHNVVARDYAVVRRNDKRLAMIAEQNPDIVRPLESAVHEPVGVALAVQVMDAGVADLAKRFQAPPIVFQTTCSIPTSSC